MAGLFLVHGPEQFVGEFDESRFGNVPHGRDGIAAENFDRGFPLVPGG